MVAAVVMAVVVMAVVVAWGRNNNMDGEVQHGHSQLKGAASSTSLRARKWSAKSGEERGGVCTRARGRGAGGGLTILRVGVAGTGRAAVVFDVIDSPLGPLLSVLDLVVA